MLRKTALVVLLTFLSPLIAEFLLGNIPASQIWLMLPFSLLYGAGAVLIRETVRHTHRGWPSFVLLGLAFGLIEEGWVTQSLFNPNYLHLRLLDYGFAPALGIGIPWSLYVLSLHVIWSTSVPIGLTEALDPAPEALPWLGRIGVAIYGLLFLVGVGVLGYFSRRQNAFDANPAQVAIIGVLVACAIFGAIRWPRPPSSLPRRWSAPGWLLLAAFALGSVVMILNLLAPTSWHWPWYASVGVALVAEGLMLLLAETVSRHDGWTPASRLAVAAGGLGVYVWFGFVLDFFSHGADGLVGHALIVGAALSIALAGAWKTGRHPTQRGGQAATPQEDTN